MNIVKIGLIIVLVMSVATLSYAASNVTPATGGAKSERTPWVKHADVKGASDKVDRGLRGVLFCWTAIPKSIVDTTKETKNPILGLTVGTWTGLRKMLPKAASGAADLASLAKQDPTKPLISPDEMQGATK